MQENDSSAKTIELPDVIIDLALYDRNQIFKHNFLYSVEYKESNTNYDCLVFGGVYDLKIPRKILVEDMDSEDANPKMSMSKAIEETKYHLKKITTEVVKSQISNKMEAFGFTVSIEKLAHYVFAGPIKNIKIEKPQRHLISMFFKFECLICSVGANLLETKMRFSLVCWQNKIPNLIYNYDNSNAHLEEQLEFAERNDINIIVIIKEKVYPLRQKATIKVRKDKNDKNKIEKEMTIDEFISYLSKYYKPQQKH